MPVGEIHQAPGHLTRLSRLASRDALRACAPMCPSATWGDVPGATVRAFATMESELVHLPCKESAARSPSGPDSSGMFVALISPI